MNVPRFNAEDVRQKALLKATADTYGGTLPLPRRPRRPVVNQPPAHSRPLTSTPHGTLPRTQSPRSPNTPSSATSPQGTPPSNEHPQHRLHLFPRDSASTDAHAHARGAVSTPQHLTASCSTLSPRNGPHVSTPHYQHHGPSSSRSSLHLSPLNASCRRIYEERVKACRKLKLDSNSAKKADHQDDEAPPNSLTNRGASLNSSVNKLRSEMVCNPIITT